MTSEQLLGTEFLSWRRSLLNAGGRTVDFDWLLDIAGGLRWVVIQQVIIDPSRSVELNRSRKELSVLWERHLSDHVPLQYLVEKCPWRDFELEVTPAALIPRQETELLVDFVFEFFHNAPSGRWVDLGTGSGALAVALARGLPGWNGHAVDSSLEALQLAKRNLHRLSPHSLIQLHCGDWWRPLRSWWGEFTFAVCNPPYIPSAEIPLLEEVVKKHEPYLALNGGFDGLEQTRQIISSANKALSPGGVLFIEHHHDQSVAIHELMKKHGLMNLEFRCDLEGLNRFAIGCKSSEKRF